MSEQEQTAKANTTAEKTQKLAKTQVKLSEDTIRGLREIGEQLKQANESASLEIKTQKENTSLLHKNYGLIQDKLSEKSQQFADSLNSIKETNLSTITGAIGGLAGGMQGAIIGAGFGKVVEGMAGGGNYLVDSFKARKEDKAEQAAFLKEVNQERNDLESALNDLEASGAPEDDKKVLRDIIAKIDNNERFTEDLVSEIKDVSLATLELLKTPTEDQSEQPVLLSEKTQDENSLYDELTEQQMLTKENNELSELTIDAVSEGAELIAKEIADANDPEEAREARLHQEKMFAELGESIADGSEAEKDEKSGGLLSGLFKMFSGKILVPFLAFFAKFKGLFAAIKGIFIKGGGLFKGFLKLGAIVGVVIGAFTGLFKGVKEAWNNAESIPEAIWMIAKETILGAIKGFADFIFGIPSLIAKGIAMIIGEDSNLGMFFNDIGEKLAAIPDQIVAFLKLIPDMFMAILRNIPVIGDYFKEDEKPRSVEQQAGIKLASLETELEVKRQQFNEDKDEYKSGNTGLFGLFGTNYGELKEQRAELDNLRAQIDEQRQTILAEATKRRAESGNFVNANTTTVQNNMNSNSKVVMKRNSSTSYPSAREVSLAEYSY